MAIEASYTRSEIRICKNLGEKSGFDVKVTCYFCTHREYVRQSIECDILAIDK